MTSEADTISALRETNATLRETVEQLRDALALRTDFAALGYFTRQESVILSAIMRWDVASHEQIMQALYAGRSSDRPSDAIISVRVLHLRHKLDPHGVTIGNVYGRGYRMPPEHKAKLRMLMNGIQSMVDEGTI